MNPWLSGETLTLRPYGSLNPRRFGSAAGAGRDEAQVEGDGGGSRRPPRYAGQGRQGDARLVGYLHCPLAHLPVDACTFTAWMG
jgi:hypothetical protein